MWQVKRNGRISTGDGVPANWLLRVLVAMTFAGWVALVAGWYVTEIGRQPWLVQGILTAAQAASTVPAANIAFTLGMYLVLYALLLVAYVRVVFYLAYKATMPTIDPSNNEVNASSNLKGVHHA
jgi:cytochrome d ubiquinol oxidase subunit I